MRSDGKRIFTSSLYDPDVQDPSQIISAIDVDTLEEISSVKLKGIPTRLVLSHDEKYLYVITKEPDYLTIIEIAEEDELIINLNIIEEFTSESLDRSTTLSDVVSISEARPIANEEWIYVSGAGGLSELFRDENDEFTYKRDIEMPYQEDLDGELEVKSIDILALDTLGNEVWGIGRREDSNYAGTGDTDDQILCPYW